MPARNPVRRSHLIGYFGVGAIVDFRGGDSLMTAGLDMWPFAAEQCPPDWLVRDERLQARLGVTHLRLPPDFREPGQGVEHPNQHIPFVRFPQWHYCPRCGAMERLRLFGARAKCPRRKGLRCESLPDIRTPWLIPTRYLAACEKGHVADFPYMEWVHRDSDWDETHKLRLLAGRSRTGLAGVSVRCSCGKRERLTNPFNFSAETGGPLHNIGHDCSGSTPWLGRMGDKPGRCGEYLRVVQRGASNVYFPVTVSSIHLPLWGENNTRAINGILESPKNWEILTAVLDNETSINPGLCRVIAKRQGVDAEELRIAAQKKLDGAAPKASRPHSEEEFRRQEYEALSNGRGGSTTDLMVDVRRLSSTGDLTELFDRICLVRKLRETRVLRGFSRLLPVEEPAAVDPASHLGGFRPELAARGGRARRRHFHRIQRSQAQSLGGDRACEEASLQTQRKLQPGANGPRYGPHES